MSEATPSEPVELEPVEFETLEFKTGWARSRVDWAGLFERSSEPCPFYHPVFLETASRGDHSEAPTHLVLGRRADELVFALPIRRSRLAGLATSAELWSLRGFDHLSPLESDPERSATRAWLADANRSSGLGLVSAPALSVRELDAFRDDRSFVRPGFRCPYLDLPDSTEELWSSLSGNMRSTLRRRGRAAADAGIELVVTDAGSGAERHRKAFEELVRLHELRSRQLERRSAFLRPSGVEFHRRLVGVAAESEGSIVRFVEARGPAGVLATLYGFRIGQTFLFFQSGLDPAAAALSLGTQVMYRSMELAREEGARRYDFLRGADGYKARWTSRETRDHLVHRPLTATGRLGLLYLRSRRAAWKHGRLRGLAAVLQGRD